MECAQRTDADKKGGHLAKKGMLSSDLLLRESAQCPDSDEAKFQALLLTLILILILTLILRIPALILT